MCKTFFNIFTLIYVLLIIFLSLSLFTLIDVLFYIFRSLPEGFYDFYTVRWTTNLLRWRPHIPFAVPYPSPTFLEVTVHTTYVWINIMTFYNFLSWRRMIKNTGVTDSVRNRISSESLIQRSNILTHWLVHLSLLLLKLENRVRDNWYLWLF